MFLRGIGVRFFVISIHAPVKGATHLKMKESHLFAISIHAPVKGATYTYVKPNLMQIFQSTHP